jgi:hypothetical protein
MNVLSATASIRGPTSHLDRLVTPKNSTICCKSSFMLKGSNNRNLSCVTASSVLIFFLIFCFIFIFYILYFIFLYFMHVQVAELAVQYFITDNKPNIAGLILAGSADFKTELCGSDMFDPRLQVRHHPTPDLNLTGCPQSD